MDYKKQKEHYENLWKKVGNWDNESPNFKTRTPEDEVKEIIKFLKKNNIKKAKVLDIGCGGGRHANLFAQQGHESFGLDSSKYAIELAKKDAKDKKIKVNYKIGDGLNPNYPKETFDIIFDGGFLHHIKKRDWNFYKKNILRILKKEGYFFLFEFSSNTQFLTGKKITKEKNWIVRQSHYTHFFTKKEIKDLFGKDFKIIKFKEIKREGKERYFHVIYMQKL